jgi:predicted DNA-binding WGR domain protein
MTTFTLLDKSTNSERLAVLLAQIDPPHDFSYILFELVNPENNENRYYYLAWQRTLLDSGAIVRIWVRRGESQRAKSDPFPSLSEAWPAIWRHIRTRLRHSYRIAGYSPIADQKDACHCKITWYLLYFVQNMQTVRRSYLHRSN